MQSKIISKLKQGFILYSSIYAIITIMLFDKIKLNSKFLSYVVPYAISMGIVFFYVWLSGFIEPLHPDAYRDVFLNFTAVSICVMIVIFIKDKRKHNKSESGEINHNPPLLLSVSFLFTLFCLKVV